MASPFFNSAGEDEFDEEDLQYIAQSSRQGGGGGGAPKAKNMWENARGGRCAQLAPRIIQLLKRKGGCRCTNGRTKLEYKESESPTSTCTSRHGKKSSCTARPNTLA